MVMIRFDIEDGLKGMVLIFDIEDWLKTVVPIIIDSFDIEDGLKEYGNTYIRT